MTAASRPPTLSILQVMKLVAYAAVAMACISPMVQLWRAGVTGGGGARGLLSVALFEAVVVPLAWAALSFAMLRAGPWKDRMIVGSLLASVSVALGLACWMFVAYTIPSFGNPQVSPRDRIGLPSVAAHAAVVVLLTAAALVLSLLLWRGSGRSRREPPWPDGDAPSPTGPGT